MRDENLEIVEIALAVVTPRPIEDFLKIGMIPLLFPHSGYGINTGFGFLQDVRIDKAQLQELQSNLIKSHACGMGEEVPKDIVRLTKPPSTTR